MVTRIPASQRTREGLTAEVINGIQNQPHRTGADLGRELVCRFARHGSIFSRVGASDQPGAVHRSGIAMCLGRARFAST